jgi:hypothetical protein
MRWRWKAIARTEGHCEWKEGNASCALAIGHPVSAPTRRRAVLADVKTDLAGSPMPRASV